MKSSPSENRKLGLTAKSLASRRDYHESSSSRSDVNDDSFIALASRRGHNVDRLNDLTNMVQRVTKRTDEMKVRHECSGASTDVHLYGDGSESSMKQLADITSEGGDGSKKDMSTFNSNSSRSNNSSSSGSDDDMSENEGGYEGAPSSSSPAFTRHRHAGSAALHRFRRFANASLDSQGGFASLSDTTTDNDTDHDSSTAMI